MNLKLILLSFIIFSWKINFPQKLAPGFDPVEYRTMLAISERQADSTKYKPNIPYPKGYLKIYSSEVKGLANRWFLWANEEAKILILSIRGTVMEKPSWMENFYAVSTPAMGSISIDSGKVFEYKLSEDSMAAVHAGWLIGLASMAEEATMKIRQYYDLGYKDLIIMGHSQGGAIGYLYRSYLEYLSNPLPPDLRIKTYGSAVPKPGNLYYAYDFDRINYPAWALRVVSTEDWVPETPFTIQKIDDMNPSNPFLNAERYYSKLGFIQKLYLKHILRKLNRSTKKAYKKYAKYLGDKVYSFIVKDYKNIGEAKIANSMNYSTAGIPIILKPGKSYFDNFIGKKEVNMFTHHFPKAYYFICLEMWPEQD